MLLLTGPYTAVHSYVRAWSKNIKQLVALVKAYVHSSRSATDFYHLYTRTLREADPPLPPHLAAVATLTTALSQSQQPLTTLSETLSLLSSITDALKRSLLPATSLAISAGTDTFQRLLVTTLARNHGADAAPIDSARSTSPTLSPSTTTTALQMRETTDEAQTDMRAAVQRTASFFISRQLAARKRIGAYGRRFIRPGTTVVVPGRSLVVESLLRDAADADVAFRAVFVDSAPSSTDGQHTHDETSRRNPSAGLLTSLHNHDIPTSSIPATLLAHILQPGYGSASALDSNAECMRLYPPTQMLILAGATALLSSGGVLASLDTQTACFVAKACGRDVWVAAEVGKCVRGMGIELEPGLGRLVQWRSGADEANYPESSVPQGHVLDVVGSPFLTGVITEEGPHSTAAIVEEAAKLWL